MRFLSNELLIEAYAKAIECKLDKDFQVMLREEIIRRKQEINDKGSHGHTAYNITINADDDDF